MVKCRSIIPQIKPKVTRKKPSFCEDNFHGVKRAIALRQLHLPLALKAQKGGGGSWWARPPHSGSCVCRFPLLSSILLWRRRKVSSAVMAKHAKTNQSPVFSQISSKMRTSFFLVCRFGTVSPVTVLDRQVKRGNLARRQKAVQIRRRKRAPECVNRCSRAVPVWIKFKTGSLLCKVGRRWKDISLNVSRNPSGGWGPITAPALLCICKVSLQSHCCMLWRGSEHAAREVSKKADASQGYWTGRGKSPHIT